MQLCRKRMDKHGWPDSCSRTPHLTAENPRAQAPAKAALCTLQPPHHTVPRMGQSPWLDAPRGTCCRTSCSEPSQPHLAPTEDIWQLLIPSDFQQYLMNPQMFSPFAQWPELPGALFLQIPQVKGCLPAASPAQAAART